MNLVDSARLILEHTTYAVAAALLFAAGAVFSVPVLRRRIKFLLAFPRWFSALLARIIEARPSVAALALFIFAFNSVAIFVYMLFGLIPWFPVLIAFFTGLNVAAASVMGKSAIRRVGAAADRLGTGARVCAGVTFLLELPCFWYAMAMAAAFDVNIVDIFMGEDAASVVVRLRAYLQVLVPILAVSALAEAYAVTAAFRLEKE